MTEFIGCLCYCLLQLTMTLKVASRTTWHVSSSGEEADPSSGLKETQHLPSVAAQHIWEELDVRIRKDTCANTQHRAPSLDIVQEPALKLWLQYVEDYRTVLEVSTPNQVQSKMQKVTGGLTARLTTRSLTITVSIQPAQLGQKGKRQNCSASGDFGVRWKSLGSSPSGCWT